MSFSIIAAIATNNVIGNKNKLPWCIPQELAHFYQIVYNKPVVMGRKTYESIGKPIANSQNIILSHNHVFKPNNCKVVDSIASILNLYQTNVEVMIIGGESIYRQFLPFVNKMYLTLIENEFDGDVHFPKWQKNEWRVITEEIFYTKPYSWRFVTLEKK